MFLTAAYFNAGFFSYSASKHTFFISLAPFMRRSRSAPLTAMGRRPTAVSTEKRPPISSGTTNSS